MVVLLQHQDKGRKHTMSMYHLGDIGEMEYLFSDEDRTSSRLHDLLVIPSDDDIEESIRVLTKLPDDICTIVFDYVGTTITHPPGQCYSCCDATLKSWEVHTWNYLPIQIYHNDLADMCEHDGGINFIDFAKSYRGRKLCIMSIFAQNEARKRGFISDNTHESIMSAIDWDKVWDNISKDYYIERGHVFLIYP